MRNFKAERSKMKTFAIILSVLFMVALTRSNEIQNEGEDLMQRAKHYFNGDISNLMELGARSRRSSRKRVTAV